MPPSDGTRQDECVGRSSGGDPAVGSDQPHEVLPRLQRPNEEHVWLWDLQTNQCLFDVRADVRQRGRQGDHVDPVFVDPPVTHQVLRRVVRHGDDGVRAPDGPEQAGPVHRSPLDRKQLPVHQERHVVHGDHQPLAGPHRWHRGGHRRVDQVVGGELRRKGGPAGQRPARVEASDRRRHLDLRVAICPFLLWAGVEPRVKQGDLQRGLRSRELGDEFPHVSPHASRGLEEELIDQEGQRRHL